MWRIAARVSAAALLLAATTAGCSSGNTAGGTEAKGEAPKGVNLQHAKDLIEQYSAVPDFEPPGPDFDARAAAKGKTVFSLPSNTSIGFIQATQTAFQQVAKEVGLKVQGWPNQGQTSQWVQGIDTAISAKVDLLQLLNGTDPDLVVPQLKAVKAAGIPIVDTHDLDFTQKHNPLVDAYVDGNFVRAGELVAAWAIVQTNGNANVQMLTSNNYKNSFPVADGIRKEFKADCPSCKFKEVNINGPDWPTKIQPAVQSAITSDPKLNYILPTFDGMLTYIVPAVRAANAVGRVHAASYNGSPDILDLVRDNSIVTMNVGENPAQIAAAGLDQSLRVLAGLPPSEDEHLVLRVFSKDNVEEAGVPAKLGQGYGDAWRAGYFSTWGIE